MAITDVAHLLEFLDAKEIAQLLHARKDAEQDCAAVWHWIVTRTRQHMPEVELPRLPPSRERRLDPALLVMLLRRLHVAMTYHFDVRFDATRLGRSVRIADDERYATNWGLTGGSAFGDRSCAPDAVSYWECEGLSDGCHVGVMEESSSSQNQRTGFQFGANFQQSVRLLSMSTPACDNMPAIMYCESGFVTNGAFRGPRPRLPSGVNFLHAQPCKEKDRVGVLVDLLEGNLVFLLNGEIQAIPIPIDRNKSYRPHLPPR
ncbi:hypothetical protein Gpo141_00010334 [Globisporangium polare]